MKTKLTEPLAQLLQSKDSSDLVDVIVELHPTEQDEAATPQTNAPQTKASPQTRDEWIAQKQEAFNRKVAPLEETVKNIGGEITGEVWLNDTLRVRAPAGKVSLLSDNDEVAKLDVPHPLVRDSSGGPTRG